MTDLVLRQRARLAALETTESEAYELHLQVRSGLIEPKRLELLAHLGHSLACAALGVEAPDGERVGEWVQELSRWGRIPCARAVLALTPPRDLPPQPAPQGDWIDALRSWIECPCAAHASASKAPLLLVRGRRRIGDLTWRLASRLFWNASRRRRWAAPERVLQRRVSEALLPWALASLKA